MRLSQTDIAIDHATSLHCKVVKTEVCIHCESACYAVVAKTSSEIHERGWQDTLMVREHLGLNEALGALGRYLCAHGTRALERDNAAWLLEHQPRLW